MSGETGTSESGWTTDTLKVLEDEKIAALERQSLLEFRRIDERHDLLLSRIEELLRIREVAQDKFEAGVAHSFVQVNEFRGALDDLGKTMATRRELESMTLVIGDLRSRLDVGPSGLQQLQSRADTSGGRQQGIASSQQLLIAVVLVVLAFLSYRATQQKTAPVVVTPTVTVPATK